MIFASVALVCCTLLGIVSILSWLYYKHVIESAKKDPAVEEILQRHWSIEQRIQRLENKINKKQLTSMVE